MIIADLPCLMIISDPDKVKGGKRNNYYDNKAAAVSYAYADGLEAFAVVGTSVYIDAGVSQAQSFALAQSSGKT